MPKKSVPKKEYTMEDLGRLPEGERAELLDGQIYYMAKPSRRHEEILMMLFQAVWDCVREQRDFSKPYMGPYAVYLCADTRNYVEPDLCVICNPRKYTDEKCIGAPDWIMEIVDPDSRIMDYEHKLFHYKRTGVREYWILDEEQDRIRVYNFQQDTVVDYGFTDQVPVGIYPGESIRIWKNGSGCRKCREKTAGVRCFIGNMVSS